MIRWIRAVAFGLGRLLMAPLRALIELGEWFGAAAGSPSDPDSEDAIQPLWKRAVLFPVRWVTRSAALCWQIVSYPFQGWFQDPRCRRRMLLGLPAILGIAGFIIFVAQRPSIRPVVQANYFKEFDAAEQNKDYAKARLLASTWLRDGAKSSPEMAFRYCKLLAADDEMDRANAIIEILAPDNAPGYAPAHAQRAVAHAELIARGGSTQLLKPLLWHLNHSNDRRNESIALAWAIYYQATQQYSEWLRHVEIAAQANPDHWFSIANFMTVRKDIDSAQKALRMARDGFLRKLSQDPLSISSRLAVAEAQKRLAQFDEAKQTILTGVDFHPGNAELERALEVLELARLDFMQQSRASEEELLEQGIRITAFKDQQRFGIDSLVSLYGKTNAPDIRRRIRETLEAIATAEESNAIVRLALSTVALLDQRTDDAMALLEQSLALDPSNHLVKNNLAWLLAERDPSQIQRATRMAEEAVAAVPASPNYHDTLGMILFLQGNMERAITELERALPGMQEAEKPKLYERLAKAYESIGNASLAETYRSMAQRGSKKSNSN